MITIEQIMMNENYNTLMKSEIENIFGSELFSNDILTILNECLDDLAIMGYHTWLYGDANDITDVNIFIKFVSRWLKKKYKYFEFYQNRWSISSGTEYGDVESISRKLVRDRDIVSDSNGTFNRTHNSTTDMDYTSNSTDNTTASDNSNSMSENAPLGASDVITTPYGKDKSSSTSDEENTSTRTDTQDITVTSSDEEENTSNTVTADDLTDIETTDKTYTNGVEVLKALKYNNMSIVEVISDIIDRTIYEFNVVI